MRIAFGVWFVVATLQADPDGRQDIWVPIYFITLAILGWFTFQDWKDIRKEKKEEKEQS